MKYILLLISFSIVFSIATARNIIDKKTPTRILVNAGPDVSICAGDSVQLAGSAGQVYSWTPPTGLSNAAIANPWAKPLATTTYILYSLNATGIILGKDTVVVTVNPLPTVDVGVGPTFCEGLNFQMNPVTTGAIATYNWTPADSLSSTSIANPIANPLYTTTYTLTVATLVGCSAQDTLTLHVTQSPAQIMPDTAVCASDTLFLRAWGANSYAWTPINNLFFSNIDTPYVYPLVANDTIYSVTMTDSLGCTVTRTMELTINALPLVDAGRDTSIYCRDSVQLFGNAPTAVSYSWSPSQYCITPNAPSTWIFPWFTENYILEVKDAKGCKAFDVMQLTLIDHQLFVGIVQPDTVICPGDTLRLDATTSHNVVTYNWYPSAANFTTPNLASSIVSPPTTMEVGIFVEDSLQCKNFKTITVAVDDFRIKTIENAEICTGTSVFLQTNGSNTFTYNWTPTNGLSSNIVPSPHFVMGDNNITYFVETIDSLGCYSYDTVSLVSRPKPTVYAGVNQLICLGQTAQLNGVGEGNLEWKPATGLSSTNILSPIASPTLSTLYQLVITNVWGCKDSDDVKINVFPKPVINVIGGNTTICSGDSIHLLATGADNYEWSPTTGLSFAGIADPWAFPTQNTVYQIIAGTVVGCTDTTKIEIFVNPTPQTKITAPLGICKNSPDTLYVNPANNIYAWSTGQTSPYIVANPAIGQWFTCVATDPVTGCGGIIDSVWVEAWDFPTANFTIENPSPTAVYPYYAGMDVQFTNQSINAETYTWDFGEQGSTNYDFNPTYGYTHGGDYIVMLVAANYHGCTDTNRQNIHLEYANLHVPSAFSPNEDGKDDLYYIGTWGIVKATTRIYDRGGSVVFESDDKDFQWDGTSKGKPIGEGVYGIKVDAVGENGEKYRKVGTVTLIR